LTCFPPATDPVLLGLADLPRYPAHSRSGSDDATACRVRHGARLGASAALPSWCPTSRTAASPREPLPERTPTAVELPSYAGPNYRASVPVHPDLAPATPKRCRQTDWRVAPRRAPRMRGRRPSPHRSKDVSCLRSSLLWPQLALSVGRLTMLPSSEAAYGICKGSCGVGLDYRPLNGLGRCNWFPCAAGGDVGRHGSIGLRPQNFLLVDLIGLAVPLGPVSWSCSTVSA